MSALDEFVAQAENPAFIRVATARVLLRQDLLARKEELETELAVAVQADARENRTPVALGLAQEMEALDAEIEAVKVEFKFRSVGKRAWADLLAAHPPTKEQVNRIRRIDHNPVTFPCAALALAYVDPDDPDWTPDTTTPAYVDRVAKFTRFESAVNNSQFEMLWAKCIDANIGGLEMGKSLAAGIVLRANERSVSSVTPVEEPSLAVSSSVA